MGAKCIKCSKLLEKDEIGIYKKLVNRGAREFMCMACLSRHFKVDEKLIIEKAEFYKKQGCALFE